MFNKIDCMCKTIWRTARRFAKTLDTTTVEGHNYSHENVEIYRNCVVMIDHCSHCGHQEYSFAKEGTNGAESMLRGYEDVTQQ